MTFFSIVIAVYNDSSNLRKSLDSILAQSCRDWELLIIDGGSKDGTLEILKEFEEFVSYSCSEPDKGIYDAWNKAIRHAKGSWLYFLGAGDTFTGVEVLAMVRHRLDNPKVHARIAYGEVNSVHPDGTLLETNGRPWATTEKRFRQVNNLAHQGVFHHRNLFEQFGEFDASFRIAGDYEFLLRELKSAPAYFMEGFVVADWGIGGVSTNPQHTRQTLLEFARARRMNGIRGPAFYWAWCYFKASAQAWLRACIGLKLERRATLLYRALTGRAALPPRA